MHSANHRTQGCSGPQDISLPALIYASLFSASKEGPELPVFLTARFLRDCLSCLSFLHLPMPSPAPTSVHLCVLLDTAPTSLSPHQSPSPIPPWTIDFICCVVSFLSQTTEHRELKQCPLWFVCTCVRMHVCVCGKDGRLHGKPL